MNDPDQQTLRQWTEASQWFAKADEDIRMAEMALGREPPLIDPAALPLSAGGRKDYQGAFGRCGDQGAAHPRS